MNNKIKNQLSSVTIVKTKGEKIHSQMKNFHIPKKFSGFEPLEVLDLGKINDFDDFARGLSKTAFGGRCIGEAVDVLYEMITDKACFKIMTLSGAMTMAKMGLLICDMIDNRMVDAIVSTGALMSHGFVESVGKVHFKNPGNINDERLREMRIDRVYDTLELEDNLDYVDAIVEEVFETIDDTEPMCSYMINRELGRYLDKNTKGRAILKSAFLKNIPVYIPAYTDSEMGLDFALFNRKRKIKKKPQLAFDPFLDLEHYAELVLNAKKTGIFTIGGGVPRNWAQQVAPYLDLVRFRIIANSDQSQYFSKDKNDPYIKPFSYGIRICPEPVHFGGLSGCTYSESISWGKFVPESKGGKFAEVLADATIAWPIILKAVMERMEKNK